MNDAGDRISPRRRYAALTLGALGVVYGDIGTVPVLRLVEGLAPDEIVETAVEIGADMIVIGTHGRTGLAHLLIGSVAERIVRHANVPVLTVRSP